MVNRGAGINIPIFSLRTKKSLGIGEFFDLLPFIDWAKEAGLKLIQILPINDTSITETEKDGYPYSILSAFALHPIYLRVQSLGEEFEKEIAPLIHKLNLPRLDYQKTYHVKREFCKMLYHIRGEKDLSTKAFTRFFEKNAEHLKSYAAFCVLRDRHRTSDFRKWEKYAVYNEIIVEDLCEQEEVKFYYFLQYHLDKQLREVCSHARKQGILLKGDFPMGVHPHSVEAWRFSHYFRWDKSMGAPPDFYNSLGQNWGFPSYNWEEICSENFYWLKSRLAWMQQYFDMIRIDHVLGYFRLWEIPEDQVRGLMGNFYPAKGYSEEEIPNISRLCEPFGKKLSQDLNTQRKIQKNISNPKEKEKLYEQIENVCFFKREGSYHPRIDLKSTRSFQALDPKMQKKVLDMHDEYYLHRQGDLWKEEGKEKLQFIKNNTSMLLCAEDIGVIPPCTKEVLQELNILNLHVQRMPKTFALEFEDPQDFPKTCVCTPSNHDTATLREWWEEDFAKTKRYYHIILRHPGDPPKELTEELAQEIIQAHLDSKATWAIFLLQDLLAMSDDIRFPQPQKQRINDPAKPENQWTWRMHIYVEELLLATSFTHLIYEKIKKGKR